MLNPAGEYPYSLLNIRCPLLKHKLDVSNVNNSKCLEMFTVEIAGSFGVNMLV